MKIKSISKHVLAIVLSLAVLASAMMLNTFSAFAEETPAEPDIWDGTLATITGDATHPYDGGNGTAAEPYLISTPEQFAYMLITANDTTTGSKHYKLLKDIYLNNVSAEDWYNSGTVTPWRGLADNDDECKNRRFYGHIHGNGKTVYGLYYSGNAYYSGLIYRFGTGASVEDLRISKAYVNATSWDGGHGVLVGTSWRNTTIRNCVIDDTVTAIAANGGAALIGFVQTDTEVPVTVENCYVTANVTSGNKNPRAFLGTAATNTKGLDYTTTSYLIVKDSYYAGTCDLVDELADGTQPVKFVNCYTTGTKVSNARDTAIGVTTRTLTQITGAKARVYMNAFDFNNVWYTEAGKTPQLRFGDIEKVNATKLWNVWSGTVPETVTYDGGAGTQASPYEISTAEQLAYLVSKGSGGYYKLTDDIYLNDVSVDGWYKAENNPNEWIGTDRKLSWGNFDGDGHTVYGLYLEADTENEFKGYCGLFPCLVGGTISNIRISKSYVKCMKYDGSYGVLVGHAWHGSTITNCVIDETVEFIAAGRGAALIGDMEGTTKSITVDGCYVGAKLSTTHSELPGAFFGKPFTNSSMNYAETSHLIIKNSYCAAEGNYVLAKAAADAPVKYENCYTTKAYDAEKEETAPAGVTDGATLEAMKAAGLSAVLAKFSKLGNANGDANAAVDVCDLVTLKKLELGMAVVLDIYGSDVNNDREINGLDYLALQKYILNDLSVFQ